MLFKGWRDWVDVKLAYYGYSCTRQQDNAIRMTYDEYIEKCKIKAIEDGKKKIEKALKRKEYFENFKNKLLASK